MSAAILVGLLDKVERAVRFEKLLWGSPFKDRLEKVGPIGQLAATGLDKIRLGMTAFDGPAEDLVKWYAILETEHGRFKLRNGTIFRDEKVVQFFFQTLRIRRSTYGHSMLYMFNPQGRLFGVGRIDTMYNRRHDQLSLSYTIKH